MSLSGVVGFHVEDDRGAMPLPSRPARCTDCALLLGRRLGSPAEVLFVGFLCYKVARVHTVLFGRKSRTT